MDGCDSMGRSTIFDGVKIQNICHWQLFCTLRHFKTTRLSMRIR